VTLKPTAEAALRDQVAALIIAITLAIVAGRIAVVSSVEGDTAFLSANDRSRWATLAALGETRSYEIDRWMKITDKTGKRRPWQTIDRVRHTGKDGVMHDYSSKPPLLSTLMAGVYVVAKGVLGMTLTDQPIYMTRIVLALINLPILLVFLLAVWSIIKHSGTNDYAKMASMAAASLGTMLLPMSITLGNHLPAAAATAIVMAVYLSREGRVDSWAIIPSAFWGGLGAAFTIACELPALLMFVLWAAMFFRQDRLSFWVGFVPASALVAVAFFGTNWAAHQSLIPPYAHRSDGPVIASVTFPGEPTDESVIAVIGERLLASGEVFSQNAGGPFRVAATGTADRWVVETDNSNQRFALRRTQPPSGDRWNLHRWNHWYEYPGSYWMTPRRGVDKGEPDRLVYAFHATLGHHGLFSLTPIWFLVPYGLYLRYQEKGRRSRWWLTLAIIAATLICFAFYISRPLIDRNYGGVSCCFRWMLWFAPLWIWGLLPAADRLGSRNWGRWLLGTLLVASVFSVFTAMPSPWQHPWIYRYMEFLGWLKV
jgi:hypothetical protein